MNSDPHPNTHDHRVRWHREREQRWAYGLGAAVLAVLLPVAAGYPDPRIRFGEYRSEALVSIIAVSVGAAVLLGLAAVIRRSSRPAWVGAAIVVLIVGHPILDESFAAAPLAVGVGRVAMVAGVLVLRGRAMDPLPLGARVVRDVSVALAAAAIVFEFAAERGGAEPSLALSVAVIAIGSIDFIRGQRETEGDVAAFGMTALSFGFTGLLLLAGGGDQLTVGAACVAIVTGVCAVAASLIAVFEALAHREARVETLRLSEALALSRLDAASTHLAQLAHDQRGALLAIEAAARRLQENPSFDLAAAVATEANRLQRVLADELTAAQMFDVRAVLEPMVACVQSLDVDIDLADSVDGEAWGSPDDVVEIVRALIENAMAHGRGTIRIDAERAGSSVVVRVSDEGPGVPPALRESIFDRGVTTTPRTHSGLGLWSARQLATAMGGSLVASDTHGCAFELHLPTTPPAEVTPIEDEAGGSEPTRLRRSGDG